ncbi:hypothetical protein HDE76_000255 [Rhodanobacter sp. ANJX3]|uniref:hypothetical protein n=1 Tax=unclassified Rhodanobacter TaxID=2621553 RepID=UPI00161FFA0B|nr:MULTISPECIES: hypothetical protein [unclassified Rhodanobacter]MBB5357073.1 hypothetical protein [Rhodanobacter sp. ANJX3]
MNSSKPTPLELMTTGLTSLEQGRAHDYRMVEQLTRSRSDRERQFVSNFDCEPKSALLSDVQWANQRHGV